MDAIVAFFSSISPVTGAFYATVFTWLLTAFGASFVFLFKTMHRKNSWLIKKTFVKISWSFTT